MSNSIYQTSLEVIIIRDIWELNPESLVPETRIIPLDQYPYLFFSLFMFFIYLFKKNLKNKRNKIFVKILKFLFKKNFIKILPQFLETIIIDFPSLAKKIDIDYIWLFYEKNFSFFLNIYHNPQGPFFSFEVIQFLLKKEIEFQKKKEEQKNEKILIFNNFSNKNSKFLIIENLFKNMLDEKTTTKEPFTNNMSVILIDFIHNNHFIEFRFYNLYRTNLMIPRKLRRNRQKRSTVSRKIRRNLELKSFTKRDTGINSILLGQKIKKIFSLKLDEAGPRFTLKNLEFLGFGN